jgi:transposase InsO family protein
VNQLKKLIPKQPVAEGPPRRGFAGQRVERENEHAVRRHVVEVSQRFVEQGWNWGEIAQMLGLVPRTLRDWRHDLASDDLPVIPLGRPTLATTPQQRNEVIRLIDELGPGIGLPTLRLEFTGMARAELEDILRRYRRVWRKRNQQPIRVLHWTRPGTVWAIDFHGPRPLIDGLYPNLLAVRDLSSGQQLLWLPVQDMKAPTVLNALNGLFAAHGAPLALKSDNGSAFIADEVQELLAEFRVKNLFSPPRMPSYNGAIEAGIGSLKSRTEQHATRHGHPGYWTWHDAEAARLEANATARPHGPLGPSPDQLWNARNPITEMERNHLSITVANQLHQIEAAQGWPDDNNRSTMQQRATDRQAIHHALVEHGYLYFTRRRIPLPIQKKKVARIT